MNAYERLGKTVIIGLVAFVGFFFLGAGIEVILGVFWSDSLTGAETLNVCLILAGIFSILALLFGWLSTPDLWSES